MSTRSRALARSALALAAVALLSTGAAQAQDRIRLGYGRLFVNDSLAQSEDRWQTGGITASRVWGYGFDGALPGRAGDLLELRTHGRAIAPASLHRLDPDDRLYAGVLSAGLHTHFQRRGAEVALGGDLVFTGPRTGIDQVQTAVHDLMGIRPPSSEILDAQIGNGVHPTLVAEIGSTRALGAAGRLRPFAELRWGDETLARAGLDLTLGGFGADALMVREPVTGQRYEVIGAAEPGFSVVFGADIAQVADSVYLPDDRGPDLRATRSRLRAGLHWQGQGRSLYYGLARLGREFKGQGEPQLVGAARVSWEF
ncbi:hypothetical protein SAMN05444413_11294 [Roseivivax marinus]|uniref:lipid A-modifier LpxR family protein n=1 Tax=Roseivivax marinus TaxID=1379903 RepID=UPI0008D5D349|nr:lipid A-modifier LpxR family protein [Roseivivax marinus]SEL64369.1 hypothetical protein SAMN05444413_11294 [Roseivivax marinus]